MHMLFCSNFPQNELTGEHSCIMLKTLNTDGQEDEDARQESWLMAFWKGMVNVNKGLGEVVYAHCE